MKRGARSRTVLRVGLGPGVLLVGFFVAGTMTAAKPSSDIGAGDGAPPVGAGTVPTVAIGDTTWSVDVKDGCLEAFATVSGEEEGRLGTVCPSDKPLAWGIGGLDVGGQWFSVAYGLAPAAAVVRVATDDGTVRDVENVALSDGAWMVVFPGDPASNESDVVQISSFDKEGSLIAQMEPPSVADLTRLASVAAAEAS